MQSIRYSKILAAIQDYVEDFFRTYDNPYLLYHNIQHTKRVVDHCAEIASFYNLNEDDRFVLLSAAWFHDLGHNLGEMAEHEVLGVRLMRLLLDYFRVGQEKLEIIEACIMATKMPVDPRNLLEKIICDADTYHLGTTDFWSNDARVWEELAARLDRKINNKAELSLQFLRNHHFYTSYCQERLGEGKRKNVAQLEIMLTKKSSDQNH